MSIPTKVARPRPWKDVLAEVKGVIDTQPQRLAVVRAMPKWMQFAGPWVMVSQALSDAGDSLVVAHQHFDIDDRLADLWGMLGDLPDMVFGVVEQRCPLSVGDCHAIFETMQANGLIYPDGTLQQHVKSLLEMSTARHILRAQSDYTRLQLAQTSAQTRLVAMQRANATAARSLQTGT